MLHKADKFLAAEFLAVGGHHGHVFTHAGEQKFVERRVVLDELFHARIVHTVQRRLGDVDKAALHHFLILPEEKGQQQGADVRSVHVGVCHDDDFMVAQLVEVGVFLADTSAHGGDERLHFLVGKHLVKAGAFRVQDFAAQGQNGLIFWITPLLCRTTCRITFHDEQFGFNGILALAVGQFAGQRVVRKRALAADKFLGAAGCIPRPRGVYGLVDNEADILRIFLKIHVQAIIDHTSNQTGNLTVAKFGLGLPFKLRLGQLDADNGSKTLAHVITRQRGVLHLFDQISLALDVAVNGARERSAETHKVGAAFLGADVVGKGENVFLIARIVLQGKIHGNIINNAFTKDDGVNALLAGVEIAHKLANAALGVEHMGFADAFVDALDGQALVKIGQLLKALLQCFI